MPLKVLFIWPLIAALLLTPVGCYKPSYLQGKTAEVAERWGVSKIDPAKLSADEASVYEKMGPPQYVRFFRKLDPDRQRVYEWIYTNPVQLVYFMEGKRVDYVMVDDNPTPLNEYQKRSLFWTGVTGGTVAGLGLIYYYFFGNK